MNNLEELKKVALAATPGPWEKCDFYGPNENGTCISAVERPDLMIASTTGYYGRVGGIANTHFIALANPAVILDLIAQLEAAQKERDEFRRRLKLERSILEDTDKQLAELKALQPVAWMDEKGNVCTVDNRLRGLTAECADAYRKYNIPLFTAAKPAED
ncbi:TPA: ead/Ea22-like family protein [Yersinia enterocolitica]